MAVSSFSLQGTLLILSPSSATLKSKINFHLKTLNPQFYQVPVEITADLPVNHRHSLYSSGSVCFITPRILIVDLLTNKLPASIISGLIILNAHSVSKTSTEAFIVRIFRSLNRSAFVRVFSDRPQAMVSGFAKAERTMKCLHIRGESTADNCQILQSRVNRLKSDKYQIDSDKLKGYSCDINFTDKELDIIDMAVYGDVIRPGNQCRCRTVDEMLGKFKCISKGLSTWKKETIVKEEFVKHLESTATSNEDVEYKYLPSCPDDEPQKKINQGTILSNIQWKKFGLLCFVWIAVLLLQIAKNYTATCSIKYWLLTLLQTPVTVGVSMYQAIGLYQGKKITVSKQDHGTHWPLHLLIVSLSCALLAGILGGLLGVGSGFVMGPLFIEFGIAPQVASATATLGMTFTASISVAQYFLLNRFPVPYALYLTIVATIAAYIGQKIIDRLVNIFQRASLIIFVLSFTILVSAIALGEYLLSLS
ncbi:sulfite exporter TauE/SafE family protein 3-like [Lathyrus oleraceus]|nr:sulfite exporter TauE/SafE family protein 3-like [Pisum sativum]